MQIAIFYFQSPKKGSQELHTHIFEDVDTSEMIEQYAKEAYDEYIENWFQSSLKKSDFNDNLNYVVAYNQEYQDFYDNGRYYWKIYTEKEFEKNKIEIKDKFKNTWQWENLLDDIAEFYENRF